MANKTVKKKKAFKAFCREQVKQGLINDEAGHWIPHNTSKAMHNHMVHGYKLGG